jgi:hypothetical protein
MSYAPIVVFTYKRLDCLKDSIAALKRADLSSDSQLFVFSDAAKNQDDLEMVNNVRAYLKSITGFKSITLTFADTNKGLAESIISGVTAVISKYEKVIVLEDDLLVSKNFLSYMNQSLDFYKSNPLIFSISGYSIPTEPASDYVYDIYFTPRSSSWGWGTWKSQWENVDWRVSDYENFKVNKKEIAKFNKGGQDLFDMLKKQMNGEINSWAIRWCYHQFRIGKLTVYPVVSKINNIGFNYQATHSNVYNRYITPLDSGEKKQFLFPHKVALIESFLKRFQNFYSIKARAIGKIKTYLFRAGLLVNPS